MQYPKLTVSLWQPSDSARKDLKPGRVRTRASMTLKTITKITITPYLVRWFPLVLCFLLGIYVCFCSLQAVDVTLLTSGGALNQCEGFPFCRAFCFLINFRRTYIVEHFPLTSGPSLTCLVFIFVSFFFIRLRPFSSGRYWCHRVSALFFYPNCLSW